MKIKGLDALQKRLNEIGNNAKKLDGSHDVPMSELLPDSFIAKNTDFNTFEEFASAPIFQQYESFEAIPDAEFDQFIKQHSRFENWKEMQIQASKDYTVKKLGF